jgi:F0F1-type ATP synthase assembly protein I
VRVALRAEGAKVLVIVVLLWLAFVAYRDMVVLAFLGAFVVSVLLSGLAFAVSGDQLNSSRV